MLTMALLGLLIAVPYITDQIAGAYDAERTDKGIRSGVAVEGNAVIKLFFGDKPSLKQLDAFNIVRGTLFAFVGVLSLFFAIWALYGGAIGALIATTFGHIVGGKNWEYLMAGGNPNPKQNAFQKIIGLLSWNEDK